MKALILAGGAGTRLWPISRQNQPKQIQPFFDDETLLQKTHSRIQKGFDAKNIFISTGKHLVADIINQLPNFDLKNIIVEPCRKDKAPAIGLAIAKLYKQDPNSSIVTIWSDHFIQNSDEYIRIIKTLEGLLDKNPNKTVLVGINPTYPETGYGYIKMSHKTDNIANDEIFQVEKFVEKPDSITAIKYLEDPKYLWNPGIFAWKTKHLLNLYKEFLPEIYKRLETIMEALGTKDEQMIIDREYNEMPSSEIETGILEKTKGILVLPAKFDWADIGNWKTIHEILVKNDTDNFTKGKHISIDSSGNLIYSSNGKLTATIGVNNMIIIETEDALLICPKNRAQDVKQIIQKLKEEQLHSYL